MNATQRRRSMVFRAVIEITFIQFLFYANLLMGEYLRSSDQHKTFMTGLLDIVTYKNFGIGMVCAVVGYVVFEWLRKVP